MKATKYPKPAVRSRTVTLEGNLALTEPQARALLKAGLAVITRHDFKPEDDTITAKERNSLWQALSKLEFALPDRKTESDQ